MFSLNLHLLNRFLHPQAAIFLRFRPSHAADGSRRSAAMDARRSTDAADAALDTEAGPTWRTGKELNLGRRLLRHDVLIPVYRRSRERHCSKSYDACPDAPRQISHASPVLQPCADHHFTFVAEPLPKGTAVEPEAAAKLEDENNHMLACTAVSVAAR